jgi:cobalt-zinc-cadmium resistance protein CzcA
MADSMARRLNESQANSPRQVLGVIRSALLDMHRPVLTAFLLVTIAFLPLLFLTQIEGVLFRPMVLTILFALLGGLLFALFVLPVLVSFCFQHGYLEWKNPLLALIIPWYQRSVEVLIKIRWVIAGICLAAVLYVFGPIYSRLGVSFLPYMDEGLIWVRVHFPEGTSLEQTSIYGRRLREVTLEFPEIQFVTAQAGRNDSGNDPFPPSRLEMMIAPKPQACWEQIHTKQQLITALSARFHEEFPTTRFNFTQPIHDSVTEENNGVSANMAVEITGSDIHILSNLARKTVDLLQAIPGSSDRGPARSDFA